MTKLWKRSLSRNIAVETESYRGEPNGYGGLFSYPVSKVDYVMYIEDLENVDEHHQRLQTLREAQPGDTVRIIINTYGGAVNLTAAYLSAMRECQAEISVHAEGIVYSAGTVLWLAGTNKTVAPLTEFMFHNYQGDMGGDGAHMYAQAEFHNRYYARLFQKYYGDVLTEKELERIDNGGQVWMDEEEILKRVPDAVLLTDSHIRSLQGRDDLPPAEPGDGKTNIRIRVDGKELLINPDIEIKYSDFGQFKKAHLAAILYQLLCNKEGVTERDPVPNTDPVIMLEEILDLLYEMGFRVEGRQ